MGLFSFAKDIGKHLFGKDAEASEKIKEEIERHNPGIHDLNVGFENGVVSLSGHADSPEAMDLAADAFARLQADGLLIRDMEPAFHAYRMSRDGHTQTGVVGVADVAAYDAGRIRRQ